MAWTALFKHLLLRKPSPAQDSQLSLFYGHYSKGLHKEQGLVHRGLEFMVSGFTANC